MFLSGRTNKNGQDKYLNNYTNNSVKWHYGPDLKSKGVNLLFFKGLIILLSFLPFFNKKIKNFKCIVPSWIFKNYPLRKIREYYLWNV